MSKIPTKTVLRRCAWPLSLLGGHRRAVLCVHGFTGYPGEMAYPAQRLFEAGWDVHAPRLSGHGTSGDDFRQSSISQWRRQVFDAYLELKERYKWVGLLGHSMGGLLVLDLATWQKTDALVVMAPALGVKYPGKFWLPLVSRFVERKSTGWEPNPRYRFYDERDDDDDLYLGREYWSWTWYRQLNDLFGLEKKVLGSLGNIHAPVLGLFGGDDAVTGIAGDALLKHALKGPYDSHIIDRCRHCMPYDPNPGTKEMAIEKTMAWFERHEH